MNVEIKTLLYDIVQAINEIESFFIDTPGDFAFYRKTCEPNALLSATLKSLEKP